MDSTNNLVQDRIQYLRENTDFVSTVFNSLIGYAIIAADFDGNIIAYNKGAYQVYGYTPEEVIGRKNIETFFPEEFIKEGKLQNVVSELVGKGRFSHEGEKVKKDGSRFPAKILFTLTKDKSDQIVGFVEIVQDLTAQKQVEGRLRAGEERLRRIIDSNIDGMLIVDGDGIIRFVNPAAESTFVRPEKELLGSCFGFPTVPGERIEIDIVRPIAYGRAVAEMRVTDIEWHGQKSYLATLRDITDRKTIEEKLAFLSLRDSLTGLYNRFFFEEEMRRFGNGRFDPVGVIMCDVDGLKLVNDAMGHHSGDELLLMVSKILRDVFRESDVVARVGGDEFSALLPNTPLPMVGMICNRLEEYVEKFNQDNKTIPVSISIGYAVKNGPSPDMAEVYSKSDDNMYKDKRSRHGTARNRLVQYFIKNMEEGNIVAEGRAERFSRIFTILANNLGMNEYQIRDLLLFAEFHDIGNIGMLQRAALKPGPLNVEELSEMRAHAEIGYRIAQTVPDLVGIAEWILKHHEWWNGKGYPLGLKGEGIPLECRIIAIADAYDSMTHKHSYRKAMTHEEAEAEIRQQAGTQFDPDLVEKFLEAIKK